ncbi:MAG: acyl carrier protein, partial [Candidatus Poribacteria bacterium]
MNYTDEQVFEKVRTIIAGVLRISPGEVKLDSVLTEELGMESLDFV